MGFFELSFIRGGGHEGPHHKSVVAAPMIMKVRTVIKSDVLFTMVMKSF